LPDISFQLIEIAYARRQLPVIAIIPPFYVVALSGGWRSVRALWPVLLVAGGSFAIAQFVSSNFMDYSLTDVLSSLASLIATLLFLRIWRPAPAPEYAIAASPAAGQLTESPVPDWQGWLPWVVLSGVVQGVRDRATEHSLARAAPCDFDHALQRQAL
jgi:lactate permease